MPKIKNMLFSENYSEDDIHKDLQKQGRFAYYSQVLSFNEGKDYTKGDTIEIEIFTKGEFEHPFYGKVLMDDKVFNEAIANFDANVYGQEIPVNRDHRMTEAQGRFTKIYKQGESLFGTCKLTKNGAENLNGLHYKYFSGEICSLRKNKKTGEQFANLLTGGAFTNQPFFKDMKKLAASEQATEGQDEKNTFNQTHAKSMNRIKELLAKQGNLSFNEKVELTAAYSELSEEEKTDEVSAEVETKLNDTVEAGDTDTGDTDTDTNTDGADDKTPDTAPEAKDGDDKGEFSENKYAEVLAENQKLKADAATKAFSEQLGTLEAYSENAETITAFAMSITDEQRTNFFSILKASNDKLAVLTQKQVKSGGQSDDKPTGGEVTQSVFHEIVQAYCVDKGVAYTAGYDALKKNYTVKN